MESKRNAVRDAIARYGSQQDVADALGVSRQSVKAWVKQGAVTPAYVLPFCQLTGVRPEVINEFARDVVLFNRKAKHA